MALAALALLPACASLTMDGGAPVESHLRQWRAQHLADYRYDFARSCFCAPEVTQPVTIEVRGGAVSRVVSRATGQPLAGADVGASWPTVDELFQQISQAQAAGAVPLIVRWDDTRGYPTYIEIGTPANDAGVVMTTGALTPL